MSKFNFLSLILLISLSYTQIISHKIIKESNSETDIIIDVLVSLESEKIKDLKLYYKSENQINYLEQEMIYKGDGFYYAIIPGNYITSNKINYYILLELNNNQLYSFPYQNPISKPMEIKINKINNKQKKVKSNQENSQLQILSPLPNTRVYKNDLLISLSYFKLKNIDLDKTKVFLNNREVTDKVTFNDNYFIYKPDFILDGKYKIEVIFTDKYNRQMDPFNWSFTVLSKDKLTGLTSMFNHSGRFSTNYSINNNQEDNLEVLNFNFDYRPNFDFLKLRTKIKWSDNYSEYQQDKNRYFLQFKAPYINLELFDSYPYISQYALNSYKVRGFNLKIDSKIFDFNLIQGDLIDAVSGNPENNGLVLHELINTDSIYFSRDNYSFRRNILALNFGIGNPKGLFYNFNIVKSKDNINSLLPIPDNVDNYRINISEDFSFLVEGNETYFDSLVIINDDGSTTTNYSILYKELENLYQNQYQFEFLTENWVGGTPKDNLVIGSNLKWSLDDENINFNFGSSISLLNQNIWEPTLSIETLDTLFDDNQDGMFMDQIALPEDFDFSSYENIFKFSFNQAPLLPIDITSGTIGLAEILTMPSLAYNIDLSLKYFSHNMKFGIRQIGPQYYSLANPYLQSDIREQYINDRFRLLNNQLFIDCGFKRVEDGIEVIKKSLSKTDKYNIIFNYYPGYKLPTYSLSFNLLNRDNGVDSLDVFTYQEYVGFDDPEADELGYKEVSDTTNRRENTRSFQANFSLSYSYKYHGDHNFLFNISQLNKKDLLFKEISQYDSLYFSPQNFNQVMLLNIKSVWSKTWTSNININYNYYNYSKDTPYYQQQFLRQIDIKGYYYRLKMINLIKFGINFSRANGYLLYDEIGYNFNARLEIIKNIFLDFNYEYKYRNSDGIKQKNQYFFAKASYNF
tara:strand:+ start:692 stop:3430 length:2739 start_codon:yes stop_codon:yes gene_type:complete